MNKNPSMRMPLVSPTLWAVLSIGIVATLIAGGGLALLLARGAADPPIVNPSNLDLNSAGLVTRPFTLLTVQPGFQLNCGPTQTLTFQVRRTGYYSVSTGDADWQLFPHISRERNALSLYVDSAGTAAFRINQEIAWMGGIDDITCSFSVMNSE